MFMNFGYSTTDEERFVIAPNRAWLGQQTRGIVFVHPWNGSAIGSMNSPHQNPLATKLAQMGFTVTMSDLGDPAVDGHNTWGNANGVTRVHQDRDFLVNTMGCNPTIITIGMSHGGCTAFAYARDYPGNVAAVCGIEPALRLASVRAYTPELATSIQTCLGTWSTALDQQRSPSLFAGSLSSSLPVSIFYAEDDEIIAPASVFELAATRAAAGHPEWRTDLYSINQLSGLTTVGHSDPAVSLAAPHIINWLGQFRI